MPRTSGARNADYDQERTRLALAIMARLREPDGASASLRELAVGAGVSVATLKHYFGSRDGVIRAALEVLHGQGARYIVEVATAEHGPVTESLRWTLQSIAGAWRKHGLGRVHAMGIAAGVQSDALGPAYLEHVLEPTLVAVEARLATHVARGELERCDLRAAALLLVSPLVLGLLHQGELGGSKCRPLDVDKFVEELLARFLRAYAAGPGAR